MSQPSPLKSSFRRFTFKQSLWTASLLVAASLAPTIAKAEKFANQFVEFELPPNWTCQLEGAEWVCQSGDPAKKKEAIIVLAAKLKGDMDTLAAYYDHLRSVKTFTSSSGKPMKSDPRYTKNVDLNGQPWVDSLHLESEIAGFFTRYLATVKDDIGVLVTYSISKAKYQEYVGDFENMIKTLKVFRRAGGINVGSNEQGLFGSGGAGSPGGRISKIEENAIYPSDNPMGGTPENPSGGNRSAKSGELQSYLLFGGAAAVIYFILKKRKKS